MLKEVQCPHCKKLVEPKESLYNLNQTCPECKKIIKWFECPICQKVGKHAVWCEIVD